MLGIHTFWFYGILLRIIEFIETIIFVLRKKQNQISFLHVYHHISTIIIFWVFLKYSGSKYQHEIQLCLINYPHNENFAGFMELYLGVLNSLVHVFMYSYYLLSSVSSVKRLMMTVKPFLTLLQLTQFCIITGHCLIALLPPCQGTRLFYIQFPNVFLLIYLFTKFFIQTYLLRKKKKKLSK
jgi:hypothetical protein